MELLFYLILFIMSGVAGFGSGLLGIGGSLIIVPSFLYIVPLLGFPLLPISTITAISAAQVATGSFFSYIAHKKYGFIQKRLLYKVGISSALGSLIGATVSKFLSGKTLLIIYLFILIISLLSIIKRNYDNKDNSTSCLTNKNTQLKKEYLAWGLAFVAGILLGATGFGGAVIFIPILGYFYNLNIKACIGNATFLVFITGISGFTGKLLTSQIHPVYIIFIALGAYYGSHTGTKFSHKLDPVILHRILTGFIVFTFISILISVIK